MSKYRKKPVVIDAVQWTGGNQAEVSEFFNQKGSTFGLKGDRWTIGTLEGNMVATPSDWIIKGVKGEFYPCKPDIFEATYEAVGETDE